MLEPGIAFIAAEILDDMTLHKEDIMDFFEVIANRRSHKDVFFPDKVPLEDLNRIAAAGLAAPSGSNSQCVRLVILPDRGAVQPLADIAPAKGLVSAPAAIAVLTDTFVITGKNNFELEDYAAAAENMILAAVALGYATAWLDSPFFDEAKQKAALKVLQAPESCHLRMVLPVGKPDGQLTRREKLPFAKRVFYGTFGQGAV